MSRPARYLENKNFNRCKENKNFLDFRKVRPLMTGPNKGKKVGWTDAKGNTKFSICKICENSGFIKRYRSNPYHQLFHNFKKRASLAGVPFELTKDEMKYIFKKSKDPCPVFGLKYEKNATKNNRDHAASLDRIDPKKGYTKKIQLLLVCLQIG